MLSSLISSKTGVLLGSLLFVAVVAAVMSTLDTAINTGALSLTRDIFQRLFAWKNEGSVVLISRISTIAIAGSALLIAARLQSILKTLGLASEIMAEGLFIPGVAMLFLRKKRPMAGFLSLFFGGLYSLTGFLCGLNLIDLGWPEWPYSVPWGLSISFFGFVVGASIDNRTQKKAQS
jgi:SSS family solute:Na+ symporter